LRSIFESYGGNRFELPNDDDLLSGWRVLSHYYYGRDVLGVPDESLDERTQSMAVNLLNSGSRVGWELLQQHQAYLSKKPLDDAWARLYNLQAAESDLAEEIANEPWAVEHRRRVIEICEKYLPPEHPTYQTGKNT
jgi:hypothetical protein